MSENKKKQKNTIGFETGSVGTVSHMGLKKAISVIALLVVVCVFLFPVYLALISSFKTGNEIMGSTLSFPKTLYLDNYVVGMQKSNFFVAMKNSLLAVVPSVILIVIFSSMSGYTIARNSKVSRIIRIMDTVYLASLMVPFTILMIPVYRLYKQMGLINNLVGYSIMLVGTSIAYASFLYVGFVKSVPKALEESASIDGAGPYYTFFRIVFPLLMPVTATVAALHVMWLWNDFNISIILLQKEAVRTLTIKQYYFFGEHTADYGPAFAASILCMIPVLVVFILMQKYIVAGISAGAVKS